MKLSIWLSLISLTFTMQYSATASLLPFSANETIEYKIATPELVSPKVGGIDLMVNGTEVGYINGMNDGVWAGCHLADIKKDSDQIVTNYKTFCMNALTDPPFSYTQAKAVNAAPEFEWIWGTYYDSIVNNAIQAAAFQLAYWEIIHETSGTYDIENGSFYLLHLNTNSPNNNNATWSDIVNNANLYLDSTKWTTQAELLLIEGNNKQGFVAEIPEPATMLLLSIGGFVLYRKK